MPKSSQKKFQKLLDFLYDERELETNNRHEKERGKNYVGKELRKNSRILRKKKKGKRRFKKRKKTARKLMKSKHIFASPG